ncbi:MAG TPA: hypothetical protein VGQ78_04265 [Vicinamibacteria bacterium]|nr:hypothetical protein [Vicinamibacteria bacterium]
MRPLARGFESKSVADQQENALERRSPRREAGDPAAGARRRGLELARADVLKRMEAAQAEGYRDMLRRALAALDEELRQLG